MALKEFKKIDGGKATLEVAIDAEQFNAEIEKQYKKTKNKIVINGYRKGKVPRSVIEKMYGEGFFFEDAINELLPSVFEDAVKEADIEIIGRPEVDIPEADKVNGVKAVFTVTLRPELTVKEYKGLKGTKRVTVVTDVDIDKEIDALREKGSRLVTVEDRAAEMDDIAVIDFEGFTDGVAFEGGKGENFNLTLGSGQFIPGFEEKIVGHNVGEEFDIDVTFPDSYGAENLAGKPAVFKINLKELRKKELPVVDDEFVKDVSEFDTVDELKADLKAKLEKTNEQTADENLENSLVDALVEGLEGEVPDVMVEQRIDELMRDFEYRMSSQGLDFNTYLKFSGQTEVSIRESMKDNALRQVKMRLALEAVVRAEDIQVSDEDIQKEYDTIAAQYGVEADKVKEFIPSEDLVRDVKVKNAIDFIKEHAEVTVENAEASDKQEDAE